MTQPVCPACNARVCRPLELVDVTEQHWDYAPNDRQTQVALDRAAAETVLQYQIYKSTQCGVEFSDPMCAPTAKSYQLAYRELNFFLPDRWEFSEVLNRIRGREHLFEFGCGSGEFLERCQRVGALASGMDFSADAVASCVSKGLDVSHVDLNSMNGATGSLLFPQMVAFHVVEHLEKPAMLFTQAAARAAECAHLWLSVPSDQRITRRMGVRDFLDQPPHHMTRWTPEAFRAIGMQHGWRLVETLYEPISLRTAVWSLTFYSPRYQRWKAAGRFKKPIIEKAYRALVFPAALFRWLLFHREMSGFSMLVQFIYESH